MYRCQCDIFDVLNWKMRLCFFWAFGVALLVRDFGKEWRCLWDVWTLEVQSPQWKAALIAMALFLEAWQHVVQWYYWMPVLLCKIYSTHEMLEWFPSTSWFVHCTCFIQVGLWKEEICCVETEEYCYFVKGGQTAREESALGRQAFKRSVVLIHLDFGDRIILHGVTMWNIMICYWCFIQRPGLSRICSICVSNTWKQSRNSVLKTPCTEGHWRRTQMAEWQLNDVLLRAPWKRSETAISPTFSVLDF